MTEKPINTYKILSCYKDIKQILHGNIVPPRTVEFFISDICNHNCIGCHSQELHKSKTPFLDFEVAKKVVDEVAIMGTEGIEISGGGEPLLYPHIVELVKYINDKGMKVGMITNGTCFKKSMYPILHNLLFLRIAFDAGTRETYKKVHGVDHFEKLQNIIEDIITYKKEHKLNVTIGLKYLISYANENELLEAAEIARDLGVNYIQFKPLRHSKEGIENPDKVKALIEEAKKLATNTFQVIGGVDKTYIKQRCILNMMHPLIDASGDVFLCAFFQHRMDTHRIGNVHKQSFSDIWYSEQHRKAFLSTDFNQCNFFDCPFHGANELVQEAIVKDKMHMEFI